MDTYFIIKTLHILSSTILFGTGLGIAFFMFRSHFTDNPHEKYYAIRNTVLADTLFTFPSAIIQPLTGIWLIHLIGYDWTQTWLLLTYILYGIAGLCWLPVVLIQIQLRNIVALALAEQQELPERYHQLFRVWFYLGWPAFICLMAIFYLMVTKPL